MVRTKMKIMDIVACTDKVNPAISVVIPIYNQEKYLRKCIRSVLSQSFQNFEIILVNDGSTDKSLKICRKYALKDCRISIIDKPNEGLASARKDGFLKAQGNYICFLDSSDYLAFNALQTLYHIAETNNIDMVVGNFDYVWDNWGFVKKERQLFTKKFCERKIVNMELYHLMLGLGGSKNHYGGFFAWGRLYRRDSIMKAYKTRRNLLFPPIKGIPSEDEWFNLAITPFLHSVWFTNAIVCHYRYGGLTSEDYPIIRKGGSMYDDRYEESIRLNCESALSDIFERYVQHLSWDIRNQIHFHSSSEKELIEFIHYELAERKIVIWARNHHNQPKNEAMEEAVITSDVDKIIHLAFQQEEFLKKHYKRMKFVQVYQKVADMIGFYCKSY